MKTLKVIALLTMAAFLLGWTSSATRYRTNNDNPRQRYQKNRKIEGRGSKTSKAYKNNRLYREPVHVGPSETLIRSRTVICLNCDDDDEGDGGSDPREILDDFREQLEDIKRSH
jgi:hypothetical protein